jgi:predicted acylesterase/phospholipase RssA
MHLVDGGLVENLPISLLPKRIDTIAVSVQIPIEKRKKREKNFLFPQ